MLSCEGDMLQCAPQKGVMTEMADIASRWMPARSSAESFSCRDAEVRSAGVGKVGGVIEGAAVVSDRVLVLTHPVAEGEHDALQ